MHKLKQVGIEIPSPGRIRLNEHLEIVEDVKLITEVRCTEILRSEIQWDICSNVSHISYSVTCDIFERWNVP